jgi:hypothetical protein
MALGWTRPTFRIRLRRQEAVDVHGNFTFLCFSNGGPTRPEAGESEEGTTLVGRDGHLLAVDRVVFGERRERNKATMLRAEPSIAMRTADIADVDRGAVQLQSQHSLKPAVKFLCIQRAVVLNSDDVSSLQLISKHTKVHQSVRS